jgi:hypothetical protein
MATVIASQKTVGTEPVLIATGLVGASYVYLHSPTGGNTVYIGNSDVATSNGFALPKDEMHQIWLPEADKLYAVVGSGTETLYVMHTGGR